MRCELLVAALAIALSPSAAVAMCFDPNFYESAPDPPSSFLPSKPSVPFCLNGYGFNRTHTCSQWELDSYGDDVETYVREMQSYYAEAIEFANEATEFANQAIAFSNDVYTYVACEIEDVNTQHE